MRSKELLGEILLRKKLITGQALEKALSLQKKSNDFLGAILVRERYIKEDALLGALSEQFHIPLASFENAAVDCEFADRFTKDLILEHHCFPLSHTEDSVTFAIINPLDVGTVTEAQRQSGGLRVKTVLAAPTAMEKVLAYYRNYLKTKIRRLCR